MVASADLSPNVLVWFGEPRTQLKQTFTCWSSICRFNFGLFSSKMSTVTLCFNCSFLLGANVNLPKLMMIYSTTTTSTRHVILFWFLFIRIFEGSVPHLEILKTRKDSGQSEVKIDFIQTEIKKNQYSTYNTWLRCQALEASSDTQIRGQCTLLTHVRSKVVFVSIKEHSLCHYSNSGSQHM